MVHKTRYGDQPRQAPLLTLESAEALFSPACRSASETHNKRNIQSLRAMSAWTSYAPSTLVYSTAASAGLPSTLRCGDDFSGGGGGRGSRWRRGGPGGFLGFHGVLFLDDEGETGELEGVSSFVPSLSSRHCTIFCAARSRAALMETPLASFTTMRPFSSSNLDHTKHLASNTSCACPCPDKDNRLSSYSNTGLIACASCAVVLIKDLNIRERE